MSTRMTATQVLMDGDEMRVIELVASRLDRMATWESLTTCTYLNQSTVFEGPKEASEKKPLDPLLSYLQDFHLEMECCPMCYVTAGIYVERYLRANPSFSISCFNVHRLVLAGLVVAIRIDKPYMRMQRFADAGNFDVDEIRELEEALLGGIDVDVDFYNIDAEAFEEYCILLLREEAKPNTPPALMIPASARPSSHSAAFQSTLRTQTPPPTSSSSTNTTTTPPPPPPLNLKLPGCFCNRGCCHCMHGKFPCSFCNHGESSKQ